MIREVMSGFFGPVWRMLVHLDYPGIGVSIAGVMVSFLLMRLSITVFQALTGFGASGSDYGRAADEMDRRNALGHWDFKHKTRMDRARVKWG